VERRDRTAVSVHGGATTDRADERFEAVLSAVLRTGVLLAAGVVAVGGVLLLLSHGLERHTYHVFHGEPAALRSVRGIARGARRLEASGLIQFGLLLLIGTPIARVVFSMVGFFRQRDWLYVAITVVVFVLLAYSLASG
jgi:uncharacterized membrane protein